MDPHDKTLSPEEEDNEFEEEEEDHSHLFAAISQHEDCDESMDDVTAAAAPSNRRPAGPQMPVPALQPIAMRPLDVSGNRLLRPGRPNRPSPNFSHLPFKNVQDLEQFLAHNEASSLTAGTLLKGAVQMIHHRLVGIPVTELSFDKLLTMFYIEYRYAEGRLEVGNCSGVRDLDAVRGNLFVYGGHIVNSLEIYIIESKDPALAINRHTLRFMDPDLNLWFCELYMRLELYNQIVPSMYRAAIPNAASIDALEEQRAAYAQSLKMYQYMEIEPPPQVFLSYFTMYMVVKLKLRLYNGKLYKEVTQPKYTIEMQDGDYVCGHRSSHCPQCRAGLRGHRSTVVKHVFEPKVTKVPGQLINTRSWKPFITDGKKATCGYKLVVKDGSVKEFITAICSSMVNRRAANIIMETPGIVSSVDMFIGMAKEPMLPPLEPYSRAWSFYNGILIDTVFYPYGKLPPRYENLSTVRLYNTWYFAEQISAQLQGAPLPPGATQSQHDLLAMPRPPQYCYEGFVQNLYCKTCHLSKYTANHDKCTEDQFAAYAAASSSSSSSSSSGGGGMPTTNSQWELHCANHGCYRCPDKCTCSTPVFYIQNPRQFLKINTSFFDRTIMPQIKAAVMTSTLGRRFLNTDEQTDVYVTLIAMLGRTFYKIGDNAVQENKARVARGEPPIPTDNLNACLAMIGKAGTGKSTTSKILENSLKAFGVLDNHASREFWGEQLLDDALQLKPIISSEIGKEFWPRDRFCKAVANEPLVIKRKNIREDVVALCEYQLTLFGNKWELEEVEGSVARRVLMFLFTKRLDRDDIDSQLFARILMDMGSWIIKALLAYKYFVERMSNNGLWSTHGVPAYFHYTKDLIEIRNNVHLSFLREGFGPNGEFFFHPRAFISEGMYLEAAHHFAARKGMTFPEWVPEIYESAFEDYGLCYVEKGKMTDNMGTKLTDDKYIRGIGYVSDFPALAKEADDLERGTRNSDTLANAQATEADNRQTELPIIQHLRENLKGIQDNGIEVPHDLLQQMRLLL